MRNPGFALKYLLLLLAQIVIWNYFNFTQFLTISFLPTLILCLSTRRRTVDTLLFAFVTGLIADFLTDGNLGVNIAALLPVAMLRRPVIFLVFGSELFSRGEDLSLRRQGWAKIMLCILMLTAVFLAVYILVDSAGMRPFWIDAVKFFASLLLSTIISIYVADILCTESSTKWR